MINMEMEIWKDIAGWEGFYQVSNLGRIKSLGRNFVSGRASSTVRYLEPHIKKQSENGNGYLIVYLKRNGTRTKYYVHRLVAQAFIPNLFNAPIVNHRDGDKRTNISTNLEWMSGSENTQHYYKGRERAEVNNDAF